METSNMKNMVVLKNLPSNIVEEAYVILKGNKKIKRLEKIENNKNIAKNKDERRENDYILKEAEMLVSKYISKIENDKKDFNSRKINKKYERIKKYSYFATFVIIIETILVFTNI